MKIQKATALCAVAGVALAGLTLSAVPANADPVSNSYAIVGSDTLQDSGNALANGSRITGVSVRVTAGGNTVGSFDAFGTAAIQTKPNGVRFARPAGSGDGVKALSRSIDGQPFSVANNSTPAVSITGQVDVARSSSAPSGSALNTNGPLAYVPYGRDAVSYAYLGTGLQDISGAQLKQIYECSLTSVNGVAVKPVLPQAASGTRSFFLRAIGVSTPGSCVAQTTLPENDGSVLTETGQIIPHSAASWIAQKNGAAPNSTGSAQLGSALGTTDPFTTSGSTLVANPAYYGNATFGRDTFVVVEFARIDPSNAKYDPALASLVDPAVAKSLTNFSSALGASGAVKTRFGFLAPGSTTIIRANLS